MSHNIWKCSYFEVFNRAYIAKFSRMSHMMFTVFAHSLSSLPVYTKLGFDTHTLEQVGHPPVDADAIEAWMRDYVAESVIRVWKTTWGELLQRKAAEKVVKSSSIIKSLFEECIAGRFGGVGDATARQQLAQLPANDVVRQWIEAFVSAVSAYQKVLSSGSLASPDQMNTAVSKCEKLLESWPKAGESKFQVMCGVDTPELRAWVVQMKEKTSSAQCISMEGDAKVLQKLTSSAENLLSSVRTEKESSFRDTFKKVSTKAGHMQVDINKCLERMRVHDPNLGVRPQQVATGMKAFTSAWCVTAYDEAKVMEAKCYFYTCMYVALTLFRSPTVLQDNKKGRAEKESLKEVVVSLRSAQNHCDAFKPQVRDMCAMLEIEDVTKHWCEPTDKKVQEEVGVEPPAKRLKIEEPQVGSAASSST